jgi:hypothetical protein
MPSYEISPKDRKRLTSMARRITTDDIHFSLVEVEDRAENGADLALQVLRVLGWDVIPCLPNCVDCRRHAYNVGDEPDPSILMDPPPPNYTASLMDGDQ